MVHNRIALVISLACLGLYGMRVQAQTYTFDVAQLGTSDVDISLLEQGVQLPGVYPVDIILNGEHIDSREVEFHLDNTKNGQPFLQPCLTREQLVRYGIKVEDYPRLFSFHKWNAASKSLDSNVIPIGQLEKNGDNRHLKVPVAQCAFLSAIPQATATFLFNHQQLLLDIPQIALNPHYQGLAEQDLWNDGISAFLFNYQAGASRTEYKGIGSSTTNDMNAQFEPGVNLGAWRFRNLTSWQKQGDRWQTSYTYAERGLYDLRSRLTLGERFTPSDVFDSVPFRGGMIGSDDNMIPYSQRRFSPVIQGVARTRARIEIEQNGYVIYSTTVAAGPYALTDLPVSGEGGLTVTVLEADGTRQAFTVPYAEPPIALHQGYLKYNLMGGQYRSVDTTVNKSSVGQVSMMYGLPDNLTVYGGVQLAHSYQAGALGLGVSLNSFGAVSLDGIQARGQKYDQNSEQGHIWRVRYSKSFESTQTGFALASYQYASSGYASLSEVLDTYKHGAEWHSRNVNNKRKEQNSMTLSQSLGEWGSLYFSGSRESYWNRSQHRDEVSARYSGPTTKGISWSVDWALRKNSYRGCNKNVWGRQLRADNSVSLWVSIPLARWLGGARVAYQMRNNNNQAAQNEIDLNGHAFDRQLSWDIRKRLGNQDDSDLNLRWDGTYGGLNGGYGYNKNSRQMSVGVDGGMIIHSHGITLGQRFSDTVALVEAPGVSGASVDGWPGVRTDYQGYTTLSSLSPYQENIVTLNPATLPPDVDMGQTDVKVVPTAGAVIPATFATRIGGRALITMARMNGKPVPFGAVVNVVSRETGQQINSGIVGDGGDVYMTGLLEKGRLLVRWGNAQQQHCQVDYRLPSLKSAAGVYALKGLCQ